VTRLHIREFDLPDYEEVVNLWRDVELTPRPGDDLEGIRLKLERDADLFLVAEENHEIIGTVMGAWDGRRAWIYRLAVKADRQRSGVGRALIGKLERRLIEKGTLKVNAQIYLWNKKSLKFFRSIGYELQPDLVMVGKALK